jgi:hypothetical protein
MLCEVAETWGTKTLPIPRNVKDCRDCTGCERGCPYGGTAFRDRDIVIKMVIIMRSRTQSTGLNAVLLFVLCDSVVV